MNWEMKMLGATVSEKLSSRAKAPLLRIGKDVFRRSDFAKLNCYTFQAATTLSNALQALTVKDTRDLFNRIHPNELALPGLGSFALAALGAAFEAKGLGTLDEWDKKHGDKSVTWSTVKHREAVLKKAESDAKAVRKSSRRNQAQHIRVERFVQRQAKSGPVLARGWQKAANG